MHMNILSGWKTETERSIARLSDETMGADGMVFVKDVTS